MSNAILMNPAMESWRLVWRKGFVPNIPKKQMEFLAQMLRTDDPRLVQGSTTTPPPLICVQDWLVEAACALGICGVEECGGFGEARVGKVEERFAELCYQCDRLMGEPAACRWFLNWFDDTPRDEMRRELLAEVEQALSEYPPDGMEVA